jgi:hypothetical protein
VSETSGAEKLRTALAWLWVGIPLAWGVAETVIKSAALFR